MLRYTSLPSLKTYGDLLQKNCTTIARLASSQLVSRRFGSLRACLPQEGNWGFFFWRGDRWDHSSTTSCQLLCAGARSQNHHTLPALPGDLAGCALNSRLAIELVVDKRLHTRSSSCSSHSRYDTRDWLMDVCFVLAWGVLLFIIFPDEIRTTRAFVEWKRWEP